MRLLVTDHAATFVIAALQPGDLSTALSTPAWEGLSLWWTEAEVYGGSPCPPEDQRTAIDRANPGDPPSVESLADYASRRRWEVEVGGTTWNGWPVATDDRSKVLVNGELSAIDMGERKDGEAFKFADGLPRPLTNAQMQAVAVAMRAHVKVSFAAMFGVLVGLQAGTVTTRAQVDAALVPAGPTP